MSLMSNHFQMYFLSGKSPQSQGKRHPAYPIGVFSVKDGYITLGPSWPNIAHALDRSWLVDDPRFDTPQKRFTNKKDLEKIMEEVLLEKTIEEWLEIFEKYEIVGGPILTLDKTERNPQVIHNKTILNMNHPLCGAIKAVATPIRIKDSIEGTHEPPPTLGQHTEEILTDVLKYSQEKIHALQKEEEEHAKELSKHVGQRL